MVLTTHNDGKLRLDDGICSQTEQQFQKAENARNVLQFNNLEESMQKLCEKCIINSEKCTKRRQKCTRNWAKIVCFWHLVQKISMQVLRVSSLPFSVVGDTYRIRGDSRKVAKTAKGNSDLLKQSFLLVLLYELGGFAGNIFLDSACHR